MRSTNKRSATTCPIWTIAAAVKTGSQTLVYWEATAHSGQEMERLESEGHIGNVITVAGDISIAVWGPTSYPNAEVGRKQLPRPKEGGADGDLYMEYGPREKRGENYYVVAQLTPEQMNKKEWAECKRKDECSIIFQDRKRIIVDWKPVWILESSIEAV